MSILTSSTDNFRPEGFQGCRQSSTATQPLFLANDGRSAGTLTPAVLMCVLLCCSENQGPPSEDNRPNLPKPCSLEAVDAAVPSEWLLLAPIEGRLNYQASGAPGVVLRHEEERSNALLPRPPAH
jgi:hypothetical protein